MFGRYAISKAPFAGQGANAYAFAITEDAALTADQTVSSAFVVSFSAPVTMADTNAEHSVYYFGNVDSVFAAQDTVDADVNFPCSFSDGVVCADTVGISAQFVGTVDEAVESLYDAMIGSAYFDTVNENFDIVASYVVSQGTALTITENLTSANTQTIVAHFNVSRSEAQSVMEHLETFGWIKIIDTQTPNWVPVDDEQ